jgi:multisubunit Na+/H+ antiporter MnhE subunit
VILLFFFSGLRFTVGFILAVWFQSFCHIERWTHKHWWLLVYCIHYVWCLSTQGHDMCVCVYS